MERTVYTLFCTGNPGANPPTMQESVTVNLVPTFDEL
jgi:hypothetical protein